MMTDSASEAQYTAERERMVRQQLIPRGIRDTRVLEAMRQTPRHRFVPHDELSYAYADGPLPIGNGQTISQPYIVALMTQMLDLQGSETVLEIGTGSGYQAAVLSLLVKQVYTVERHPTLAENARQVLRDLELVNVEVLTGDGSLGLVLHAPYQAILVTAAAPDVPQPLLDQLDDGGRLVLPVGGRGAQYLESWERQGKEFQRETGIPVAFVPLRGEHGWRDEWWSA